MLTCPECGLDTNVRTPPRPAFWTWWRAGPLGLALLLLLVVIAGSVATVERSTGPGGSFRYPAFLGVPNGGGLDAVGNLTTVGQLRSIASGAAPPTFTLDEVIGQAEDRAPDPDPSSRLLAHAWDDARAHVLRGRSIGWPLEWWTDMEFCSYQDVRRLAFEPEGAPTTRYVAWSIHGVTINHPGHQSYSRTTTFNFISLLVTIAWGLFLACIAGAVAWLIARRRDRGARWAVRAWLGVFLLACLIGLAWPWSWSKIYAFPDVSRRQETDLRLADLKKMRDLPTPAAERAVAQAILDALATKPTPGMTSEDTESGGPKPLDDAKLVLISFHDASDSTVHRTYMGWPLVLGGWERLERRSPAPDLEESHSWRLKMRTTGAYIASFVRQDTGTPHVARSIIVHMLNAATVMAMIVGPSVLLISTRAAHVHARTRRRLRQGRCIGCGYQLAGLRGS